MNDRFKFHFYHYETETMYDVKAICFEGRAIVTVQYNPVLKFPLDSGELVQCTGLKDKNSKLIYEGDIVSLDKYNYSILWNDCWCIFRERSEQITHVNSSCLEVIGNIHENPELLK